MHVGMLQAPSGHRILAILLRYLNAMPQDGAGKLGSAGSGRGQENRLVGAEGAYPHSRHNTLSQFKKSAIRKRPVVHWTTRLYHNL